MRYERPGEAVLPSAADIEARLVAQGRTLGPGGVQVGPLRDEEGTVTGWWAEADTGDPATGDLTGWTAPADPTVAATALLRTAVAEIRAKAPATRTAAERGVLALAILERRDL